MQHRILLFVSTDIPARPYNLTGMNITSRSLVLTWIEPHDNNAPITGYRVMYSEPTFLGGNMIVLNVTEEKADISGLHPGVPYEFTVVGFNEIGSSLPSIPGRISTLNEGNVTVELVDIACDVFSV